MLHSVLAVLAGYAAMAAIIVIATILAVRFILRVPASSMRSMASTPLTRPYLTTNIAASGLAALIGGRVTGAIADHAPIAHGLALAALMVVFGLLSDRRSGAAQPRWYRTLLVTAMPALAVAGAALAT